jgi:nucleotide-binding universal stress UspA family protein
MATEQAAKSRVVVVGIDGSAASFEALEWAAHQADMTNASLEIVMTWNWPMTYGWAVPIPEGYDPEQDVRKALEQVETDVRTKHAKIEITARVLQGHPAQILVEESKGADLLVVGSRGHGEFVGMVIGSVSEYCATNAHCPVLVHRPVAS